MIDPQQVAKVQAMYDRALELEGGNHERAIRLVSKMVDRVAIGGARQRSSGACVRRALGLEGGRAEV